MRLDRARRAAKPRRPKAGAPLVGMVPMAALTAAAGVALWEAMRLCEAAARPLLAAAPEWLSIVANAGIEEALRLALGAGLAALARFFGLGPGAAMLAVVSSCMMATIENAAYVIAFPAADAYWRLGYSAPIHMGAAAAYALGLSASRRRRATALAFAACWLYHAAFNILAAIFPFTALPPAGTLLNVIALAALSLAAARTYTLGGHHGRVRI